MLKHALNYLAKNKSVIPVGLDKKPLIEWAEYQKRLPTKEEVEKWWQQFPDAQIGIVTGKISNLAVVDIEAGMDDKDFFSKLPVTLVAKTGGDGWHYYYNFIDGVRNKTRIGDKLVDIRGEGGYVIAPPSKHKSGKCYEWSLSEEVAPFPVNLFPQENQKTDWNKIVKGVSSGMRNQSATQFCGLLLKRFKPEEWESIVWEILKDWNNKNSEPLQEKELRATYESIVNKEFAQRETIKNEVIEFIPFSKVLFDGMCELTTTKPEDVVSLGYDWLDNKLTGLFPGELIVVGGESGTGKTTFTTNIIYKASKNRKCAVFALEDRLNDYSHKALYFELGKVIKKHEGSKAQNYYWNEFRKNELQNDDRFLTYFNEAYLNLKNDNILFAKVDSVITVEELEKAIEEQVKQGVELFLIDHLHYFDLSRGKDTKADYIEKVMVRIKTIQRRTGARIIMVVHYKKLGGSRPTLDSFKDSISIVQNANYVINIWRDRSDGADQYNTYFSIPKARNPNGEATIEVKFDPAVNDYKPLGDWQYGTQSEGYQPNYNL
ncbi:MAG: bifunctional DNA primase/polymerase [bacterium]|nr:bifunctional DNA primase/polymerase [bacterium]